MTIRLRMRSLRSPGWREIPVGWNSPRWSARSRSATLACLQRRPSPLTGCLADVSPLAFGTGWMDAEHEIFGFPYPPLGERFELLENHLAYVRTAITPGEGSYAGTHFSLQDIDLQPPASHRPKLIVGGGGRHKTPRLAGTYADEFNVYAKPPQEMTDRIEAAHEAAATAGRDPADLMLSTACPPLIGITEQDYQAALDEGADAFDVPRDEIEEKFGSRGMLLGTLDRMSETIGAWRDIGATRFYMQRITTGRTLDEAGELVDLIEQATAA